MMVPEEPGFSQLGPVLEDPFASDELHELWSLIQPGFPTHTTSGSETSQNGAPSHSHTHSHCHSHSTSGSKTTRAVYSAEERKRRRMISNRESARRSRWRKKQQLEDLADQMNRLELENVQLKNRLSFVRRHYHAVQRDSNTLMAECIDLQQKLAGLCQTLIAMQLQ